MARILIVDDDEALLEFAKDVLYKYAKLEYKSDWELKVQTVTSAIKALEIIQENNYELIITDIRMARMSGWEFIKEIRKRFPHFSATIAVMSAIEGIDLKYESVKYGVNAWFNKPLRPKSFAHNIFKLIQER